MSVERAAEVLSGASRITVLTGAGISTDSGIPDFRGPNGLWTRDPGAARYVDYDVYLSDPEIRAASWQRRLAHPAFGARPNAGHRALVALHAQGRLRAVLTQNIDGLHQAAGLPDDAVFELHGSLRDCVCVRCGRRRPIGEALDRVRAGETDPSCVECGGILKSGTVFFGEALDDAVLAGACEAAAGCDAFVAVGTSLGVHPAAGLAPLAVDSGAQLVIVNAEPTPYDDLSCAVVRESISTVLPQLFGAESAELST